MIDYGAYNASNLDGGTSSVLVVNDQIVNDPIDSTGAHKTRPISTGFILSKDESDDSDHEGILDTRQENIILQDQRYVVLKSDKPRGFQDIVISKTVKYGSHYRENKKHGKQDCVGSQKEITILTPLCLFPGNLRIMLAQGNILF